MDAYDLVEYPAKPFLQCHPDRLSVMGRLFGLCPVDPGKCRVLEIGCGDSLNLIAEAIVLPNSSFRGIDLSSAAIGRGREIVRELHLGNVDLAQADLRVLSSSKEKFDYVIAHGLYSWVSAGLRDALLAGIQHVLSEHGVAFVSYNAYPGAYLRQMVREMARMASGADMAAAREWLAAAPARSTGSPVFRAVLADECADMLRREDGAFFHDDFAEINQPVYFRDFMPAAAAHGLQYVSEADLGSTALVPLGSGRIEAEQASDFQTGRRFRQTLLCQAARSVSSKPDSTAVRSWFAGGPVSQGIPSEDGTFRYVSGMGGTWNTGDLEERMMLESIAASWPCFTPVEDFGERNFDRLLALFSANMIDLRMHAPPVPETPGSRPEASSLARLQAERGLPLTSLHHFEVRPGSESLRELLILTDGTRTRAGLIRDLGRIYPSESKEAVAFAVDTHLEELRRYGLLLDPGLIKAGRNSSRSKAKVTRMASKGRDRKSPRSTGR